jgi:hypothetical protein
MKSFDLSHLRVAEVIAQRAAPENRQVYCVWDSAGKSCFDEEGIPQRLHVGSLFIIGGAAVAAFDVFVVADVWLSSLRRPGVPRVDAVVAGGGGEKGWRDGLAQAGGIGLVTCAMQTYSYRSIFWERNVGEKSHTLPGCA